MIKNTYKNSIVKLFKDSFGSMSENENFIFIGKTTPWANESFPPLYTDTISNEMDVRNNMLLIKKITSNDIAFCIKRVDWLYGTKYDKFDNSAELYSSSQFVNFYTMNSEKNVYKCLNNNNNSASTISPFGTQSQTIVLDDGYEWKYLYSITEDMSKFITDDFIPVEVLDQILYPDSDPRNDQLATELYSKLYGKGKITSVEIVQTGSNYPMSIDYDENDTTHPAEDMHYVQSFVRSASADTVFVNLNIGDISRQDNFYVSNYVIYFCKGSGAGQVRNIASFNGKTGRITLETALNVVVSSDTLYKIVPKINIIGDGTGAIFIPKINANSNLIEKIIVVSGGVGYTKIDTEVKTARLGDESETIIRPIFTPFYGHGSNAFKELGCKNAIIYAKFDYSDIQNQNFFNEYRQIGLITNPEFISGVGNSQIQVLDIEASAASQTFTLIISPSMSASPAATAMFDPANSSILIGSVLQQGLSTEKNYALGIVKSYNYSTKLIELYSITGKFNYTNPPSRMLFFKENYVHVGTGSIIDLTPYVSFGTTVLETNYFSDSTFSSGSHIVGDTSYSTATIDSWAVNADRISGKLKIKNINGGFKTSYYSSNGDFNRGESIVQFNMNMRDTRILVNDGISKTGTVKSVLVQDRNSENTPFSCISKITVNRSFGITDPYTESTFTRDVYVEQRLSDGTVIAKGLIVDWTIDGNLVAGYLLINVFYGQFTPTVNKDIYQYTDGIYINVENTVICEVVDSDVIRDSGDIIYTKNIIKLMHGSDSEEEIKLVIGF